MKLKIIYFSIGFLACLVLIVILSYILLKDYRASSSEFKLNSMAYTAQGDCPRYPSDTLVGTWVGKPKVDKNGNVREWKNTRKSDGKYHIEFITRRANRIVDHSTEDGLWSYSGCLYSVIVKKVNGTPVLYQEVYRVLDMTENSMSYSNFRTGNNFTVTRDN